MFGHACLLGQGLRISEEGPIFLFVKNISYIKVGKYLRFSKRDIDKWFNSHAIKSHLLLD
jgi:hypothetical protein